ncbi:peroxiredoxin-like family protein [Alteromonas sp. HB246098]
MSSLKSQTQAKVDAGRKNNPAFMEGVDREIEKARTFQQGEKALDLGGAAQDFTLPSATGELFQLSEALNKGAVVLTFYRGSWCPYCNLQLNALQNINGEIKALDAQLVAISPESPDSSLSAEQIKQLPFTVLSDQGAKVAASYGVAWEVPEFLLEHMRNDRQLDLEAINNGNSNILPIPATFILNKDGQVIWRYVDVDYRTRAEPQEIIEALQKG